MEQNNIQPEKITKPIQLLAAWLLGLILLVTALIAGAGTIRTPTWISGFFAISAVAIIPLFLLLIFLLQTKYRVEMQEDTYYAKYLDKNTLTFEYVDKDKNIEKNILNEEVLKMSNETRSQLDEIKKIIGEVGQKTIREKKIETIIEQSDNILEELKNITKYSAVDLKINKSLPQYAAIVEVIKNMGFSKFLEFGTNSVPSKFVIAIGKKVSIEIAKQIILGLIPLGANAVKLTKPIPNESLDSTVYIGSYMMNGTTPIDSTFLNELNSLDDNKPFEDVL
jgi:ABC-type multidrug transport system fused ATPase/permease subunit